jgi:RNA polymerase sigma factor (sigma-70 family)
MLQDRYMVIESSAASYARSCSGRKWLALTDEELIQAYRAGDPAVGDEPLSELFRRYQERIAKWCMRFTRDRESALDLAQDVLLRAYKSLHTYRGDSRFSTWLYVIARNQCCSAQEKRAAQPSFVDSSIADSVPDAAAGDIHQRVESEQLNQRSWAAIRRTLSGMEANIMMLHYGQDLSLGDITRALGLTNKSGAKAYIVSARRKMSSVVQGVVSDRSHALR